MKDNKSTVAVTAGDKAFIFWRVSICATKPCQENGSVPYHKVGSLLGFALQGQIHVAHCCLLCRLVPS